MEEDLELLRSMYVEGKEVTIAHHSNITKITFDLSTLISTCTDNDLTLVVNILKDHMVVNEVKFKYGSKSASLNSDLLGFELSDCLPSDILSHVTDNIEELKETLLKFHGEEIANLNSESSNSELRRTIYKLDHMRNENKYKKCLVKFAKQTGCCCLLYSAKQDVRIIVEGERAAVREFVKLNKTTTVDVDSSGWYYYNSK